MKLNPARFQALTAGKYFSYAALEIPPQPKLVYWSEACAHLLDLDPQKAGPRSSEILQILSAQKTVHDPVATRYGGHQFGHWAGQLGDGRAHLLGEIQNFEIQLKGGGRTPYSRRGDGKAVLRSSLREALVSEAMYYLGIPTTRALALFETGEQIWRDPFYDGRPAPEPGAVLTRVSESFLRFGHFEIHALTGDTKALEELLDFTLKNYFPNKTIEEFFLEVCRRTADLMVHWMRVGFVHGVMNTDNMSVLGLTIDYGPFGWLDRYDAHFTPNTTDEAGRRYAFGKQPLVALWNLQKFAEALNFIRPGISELSQSYRVRFRDRYKAMMGAKLGLPPTTDSLMDSFIIELESLLQATSADYILFFKLLENANGVQDLFPALNRTLDSDTDSRMDRWFQNWKERVRGISKTDLEKTMQKMNPVFVPRNSDLLDAYENYLQGNTNLLESISKAIQTPYELNEWTKPFFRPLKDENLDRPGAGFLSCSS